MFERKQFIYDVIKEEARLKSINQFKSLRFSLIIEFSNVSIELQNVPCHQRKLRSAGAYAQADPIQNVRNQQRYRKTREMSVKQFLRLLLCTGCPWSFIRRQLYFATIYYVTAQRVIDINMNNEV